MNGQGINKTVGETVQTKPVVIDTACKWVQPIYISKDDVLTDGTARQILAHNKAYVVACGDPRKPK